jgi:DNA ligase-1
VAPFLQLAELADQLSTTASRLKKRAAIAEAIANIHAAASDSEDVSLFALYLAGEPFAESDHRKLNVGGALLSKAVRAVTGATDVALTAAYRRHGDLGAAAFDLFTEASSSRSGKALSSRSAAEGSASSPLTLTTIAEAFASIATARTTATRAALVEDLLRRASPLEAKYLIKLMLGDMRIGVKQSLVEEAIAVAASTPVKPITASQVRHAVMLEADLGAAVQRAFAGTLDEARMRLFHPLGFMLASPVDTPEEAIARFQPKTDNLQPETISAFLEDKYDGMRAQIHCGDPAQPGRVAIYSRNREDITASFPELCEAFAQVDPATDDPLILDGEILAWNFTPATQSPVPHSSQPHRDEWDTTEPGSTPRALPFTTLGERIGRKHISNELRARVPVIFMAFDLLYANGELTLNLPLRTRRSQLEAIVERLAPRAVSPLTPLPEEPAQSTLFQPATDNLQPLTSVPRLLLSPSRLVESAEEIDRAYAAARARSNEGVMIKAADSIYQPGRRGLAWVKLKRELATLDVVITGAEYGHGKRAGLLSDYTFAVRSSEDSAELLNVGKAYSGVTDTEIAHLTEFLKAHTLEDQGHFRTVEPLIVLEVAFNNIMRSTRHASGFALRFPRILRLRSDKPLAEIDTLARVEAIYQSQVDKPAEE